MFTLAVLRCSNVYLSNGCCCSFHTTIYPELLLLDAGVAPALPISVAMTRKCPFYISLSLDVIAWSKILNERRLIHPSMMFLLLNDNFSFIHISTNTSFLFASYMCTFSFSESSNCSCKTYNKGRLLFSMYLILASLELSSPSRPLVAFYLHGNHSSSKEI